MSNHRAQCLPESLAAVKAGKRRGKDAAIPPEEDLFWQMMVRAEEEQ